MSAPPPLVTDSTFAAPAATLQTPNTRPQHRGRALRLAVLAAIVIAVAVNVPVPFWGDQALFAYIAHGMRHGDRLYVDIWDYKQPGIYLWYLGSGTLFGFHETGIHFAELLWAVAFAATTQRMMRDRVEHRWLADVAPIGTIGAYYAVARGWDLTQIEALVTFPIALSLWAAVAAGDGSLLTRRARDQRLLLSGLMAAIVVYFKIVYVAIPIAFWLYLLLALRRPESRRARLRDAELLLAGLVAPLLPLLAYFVHEHLLGTMWWTYVTYPPKVVGSISPPPLARLWDGIWFFTKSFAWLAPFAIVGLNRLRSRAERRRDPLVAGLVLWLVVGFLTILLQNQWGYQFMLLLPPLALLAVYGCDRLCREWSLRRAHNAIAIMLAVVALLALFPAKQAAHKVRELAGDNLALGATGRAHFTDTFGYYERDARAAVAWLHEPGRTPGPIHVEGNPLIQYLSGRPFALREHGWAPEQSDARLWRWTQSGLREQRPVYLWVDHFSVDIMRKRSPETLALIGRMYCKVQPIVDGAWYALRDGPDCRAQR